MSEATGNEGHRERLRRRLLEGGGEALLDHELVEYLLALTIPRRDTKPIAKRLLAEHGGIGGLLAADPAAIRRSGVGDGAIAAIKIAQAAGLRMLKRETESRPVLGSWDALINYLRADLAHAGTERVRVLHLNGKNMLTHDEVMGRGSIDQAPIYVREVIRRAIDLGSAGLILVHNHPSGDPAPSRQDIAVTREIVEAAKPLGIAVHDHVIIGRTGHASLRTMGLM